MSFGNRIKAIRVSRGLSMASLADMTGLSKGLVSQVENDKTSPSLSTLERLAQGLGVSPAYLLLRPEEGIHIARAGEGTVHHLHNNEIRAEVLSGCPARQMKAALIELAPGTGTGSEMHAHSGEEVYLVLEGQVEGSQGGQTVLMNPGDVFHWKCCMPHRVTNVGTGIARILTVSTATLMAALGEESEME